MTTIAIIPSRMGSTRFPGKPLEKINGIPMVGHCYFRTKMCRNIDRVYVATCDQEIADYVSSIGGDFVMTSPSHDRATDRTAEAITKLEVEIGTIDTIIMVQGDEPLLNPLDIESLTDSLIKNDSVSIANLMSEIDSQDAFESYNNVKVVCDSNNDALYLSREPIPSCWKGSSGVPRYNQIGIIGFKKEALLRFNSQEQTTLEAIESIDMNRVLENGGKIRMIPSKNKYIGVDTPEEALEVDKLLKTDVFFEKYR
ncbi:3-deoxy-manno-octulosonate cytidylyltransferase [Vibrio sinaloensis]|uniref:3-deoxy-manno-octulosonate cytidylyltransferase n=1 Tax=Photobacterium sp. (strain ATCC 43367) TaxID=379097 RepID=UPI00205E3B90|nr:3-deoxy-manno-octulosonate cytidylyltransferase [Vibrio sinaloensis]UPQ88107.1 3-deoxy-manno-octulosonate cytidylyltransferase [Vibrio sinaloensis]